MNVRPFFSGARHLLLPPTSIATPNDELIRSLIITSFVTQSRFAPGGLWLSTNWCTALTTAMRMVAWVHHRSTYGRTAAQMARTPGLTKTAVLVINITHLPDRCHAENMHTTLLARWQAQLGVIALIRHQMGANASPSGHLRAAPLLLR